MARKRYSAEDARGFHGAYVSNARLWSATTRSLLKGDRTPGEAHLALVALWKCLSYAELLVVGRPKLDIPPNVEAVADVPLTIPQLQRRLKQAKGFRDEVLHLQHLVEHGRGYTVHFTHDAPRIRFTSSVNAPGHGRGFVTDEITLPKIEALLDALDPWLEHHHRHWIQAATTTEAEFGEPPL